MVFPGQGSQSISMQAELAAEFTEVEATYAEASEQLGYDLWQLVQEGPPEKLDETLVTQPAMLAADVATWRVWLKAGGSQPRQMAGHSLGEYSALVCSGSLGFTDAIRLVRQRSILMQDALPLGTGAMAAVLGLEDEAILKICDEASGVGIAEAVNFNSPGQVVVAGHKTAVERVVQLAKDKGAKRAILLHVSVPSHSTLMRPAGEALREPLNHTPFENPSVTVLNCVDATAYGDATDVRERLARQVYSPVHWVTTVRVMIANGATNIVECGPGKVLAALCRRIDRNTPSICIDSPAALKSALH